MTNQLLPNFKIKKAFQLTQDDLELISSLESLETRLNMLSSARVRLNKSLFDLTDQKMEMLKKYLRTKIEYNPKDKEIIIYDPKHFKVLIYNIEIPIDDKQSDPT